MYVYLHERSGSKNKEVMEDVIASELVGRGTSKIVSFSVSMCKC